MGAPVGHLVRPPIQDRNDDVEDQDVLHSVLARENQPNYNIFFGKGWIGAPSLISSVARRTTMSPAWRSPDTST